MKGRDSNSSNKASTTSQASQKKPSFLGLFNFCFRDQALPKFDNSKRTIQHPNLIIDIDKPPAKSFMTSHTDISRDELTCSTIRRKQEGARVYHLDKVFILGDNNKIVAKITTKQITSHKSSRKSSSSTTSKDGNKNNKNNDLNNAPKIPATLKQEIFSMYDKGIKVTEWHEITPENVAIHIAERLHCSIMIDALCGCGGNTIQFAKFCDYVFGIDIEQAKTLSAKHNAHIYGVDHKIDFLTVDFLKLKNLMGDVVFLGPSDIRKSQDEPYSIFEHADPDLRDLLAKSLEISPCIALKLPGDTDLEELADLFHVSLERFRLYSKRFCIEIERIVNSFNEIECIVVYFGDCSSINLDEEYEVIYDYLAKQETPEWKERYPLNIVVAILKSVGTRKFFRHIAKIEESFLNLEKPSVSLFDTFLDELIEKNIFTKNSLNKMIDEATFGPKPHASILKKQSSITNSALTQKLNSLNMETRMASDTTHNHIRHVKGSLIGAKPEHEARESLDDFENQKVLIGKKLGEHKTITEMKKSPSKDTHEEEVSELAVSSYSVSSDYLRDSDTCSPNEFKRGRDLIQISFDGSERANSLPREDMSIKSNISFRKGLSTPPSSQNEENGSIFGPKRKL